MDDIDLKYLKLDIDDLRTEDSEIRNRLSAIERKLIAVDLAFQTLKSALETASIEAHDLFVLGIRQAQVEFFKTEQHELSQDLDEILGD